MTELFEPTSDHDWRLSASAGGLLGVFNAAGLLTSSDVHVASRVGALGNETDETVLLAVALTVRAVRRGSIAVDLATIHESAPELAWPDVGAWVAAVRASPLVEAGVVRFDHDLLYLDRYHRLETQVCDDLLTRAAQPPPPVDDASPGAGGRADPRWPLQRRPTGSGSRDDRPLDHGADRRARHRQDHHGRPDPGAARRPGRHPRRAAVDRARGSDRQGRDPAAGGGGHRAGGHRRVLAGREGSG